MYRAVAEAVSGLKVFANGKWLTCIGNKPVRVGDRIWTDGRCVYGFLKEAQLPMVIVSPQREDWAIPILFCQKYRDNSGIVYLYYQDGSYEKITEVSLTGDSKPPIFLVNNEHDIKLDSKYIEFTTYGYGANWGYKQTDRLASNLDSNGDLYELRKSQSYQFKGDSAFCFDTVDILKNGEVIKTLDFSKESREIMARARSSAHNTTLDEKVESFTVTFHDINPDEWHGLPEGFGLGDKAMTIISRGVTAGGFYITTVKYTLEKTSGALEPYVHIPWGVIEDENNWAFIISLSSHGYAYGYSLLPPTATHQLYWDRIRVNSSSVTYYESYLITPNENILIYTGSDEWIANRGATIHHTNENPKPFLTKLPIQNGYYYVINKLHDISTRENERFPLQMDVTIFSPDNKNIAQGTFPTGTYFTIYNSELLGLDDRGGYGFIDRDIYTMGKPKDSISGLYEIKNGVLNKLVDGYVKNDKLHRFKDSKKLKKILNSFTKEVDENAIHS